MRPAVCSPGPALLAGKAVTQLVVLGQFMVFQGIPWGIVFYVAFWLVPIVCIYPMTQRLKNIAEHFDPALRDPTVVRWVARTSAAGIIQNHLLGARMEYHFEHHVLPTIPYQGLRKLHRTLDSAGLFAEHGEFLSGGYVQFVARAASPQLRDRRGPGRRLTPTAVGSGSGRSVPQTGRPHAPGHLTGQLGADDGQVGGVGHPDQLGVGGHHPNRQARPVGHHRRDHLGQQHLGLGYLAAGRHLGEQRLLVEAGGVHGGVEGPSRCRTGTPTGSPKRAGPRRELAGLEPVVGHEAASAGSVWTWRRSSSDDRAGPLSPTVQIPRVTGSSVATVARSR